MKTYDIKKEWPLILVTLAPIIYLMSIWSQLPLKVPMHWNAQGEIDRYGSRKELLILSIVLPIFMYVLMFIIPLIDPKKKINERTKGYIRIRQALAILISFLTIFIIYSSLTASMTQPAFIFVAIGLLIAVIGFYMKDLPSNYFVGIKTPWTLENKEVWKKTHQFSSKLWLWLGVVLAVSALVLDINKLMPVFFVIIGITVILPFAYSYILYQKLS